MITQFNEMTGISPETIQRIAGKNKKILFLRYKDLYNYNTLDKLFQNQNHVVILIEYREYNGHYILLSKYPGINKVEYFDSGYVYPDVVLKIMPQTQKFKLNQDDMLLSRMIKKSPYKIEYLPQSLQGTSSYTCGHYIGVRIRFSHITLSQFYKFFSKKRNPDKTVIILCNYLVNIQN